MQAHRPESAEALAALVSQTAAEGGALELRGGGTKAEFGAPRAPTLVDMSGFDGVIDYDPAELVMTVGAGTSLAAVEALLAEHRQMLAFEPCDPGPIYGRPAGASTIGGVVASGAVGSRRLSRGAVRDHLLGFRGVSGRGEVLVGGAKVVKNVTGYDLPKLACGSWGRLIALTEVTLKVLPAPQTRQTLFIEGLDAPGAISAMALALGSRGDVAAAAHDPAGNGVTGLRLEGFAPSVAARSRFLEGLLASFGAVGVMDDPQSDAFWSRFETLAPLGAERPLWRIAPPPSRCAQVLDALGRDGSWLMDWGGGLVWLASSADPASLRATAEAVGGHATLVRATADVRACVPALHPRAPAVSVLEARLRAAFDPSCVFETGRFLDHPRAD